MSKRIGCIHATPVSIAPTEQAFDEFWPAAERWNLLDDSLRSALAAQGVVTPAIERRFLDLARYWERCGVDAILFTCSAFGGAIDRVRAELDLPVLKPNEAMIDAALRAGHRITLLATGTGSIQSMAPEFEAAAAASGQRLQLSTAFVPDAFTALEVGDSLRHDSLVVDHARSLPDCDAIVLTQFSLARTADAVAQATGRPVFTTPGSAVAKLRCMLTAQ